MSWMEWALRTIRTEGLNTAVYLFGSSTLFCQRLSLPLNEGFIFLLLKMGFLCMEDNTIYGQCQSVTIFTACGLRQNRILFLLI